MISKKLVSDEIKTTVEINAKIGYKVLNITAKKATVKNRNSDIGGEFYIYDLFDENNKIIAQNRYVYVDSEKQPFNKLTTENEDILNPPIIEDLELIK